MTESFINLPGTLRLLGICPTHAAECRKPLLHAVVGLHKAGWSQRAYFFTLGGGTGTGAVPVHFPVAVLVPVTRPEASRWVLVAAPAGLPLVAVLPVSRPEASRYCVVLPDPLPVRVSALPSIRPLASR